MADVRLSGYYGYFNDQDVCLNISRDSGSHDPVGELYDIAGGLAFLAETFDTDSDYGPARLLGLLASNVRGVAVHLDEVESAAKRQDMRARGESIMPDMPISANEFNEVLSSYCKHPETWRKIVTLYEMGEKEREMLKLYVEEQTGCQASEL